MASDQPHGLEGPEDGQETGQGHDGERDGMADIEHRHGGAWSDDRHPHEPKIKRQLAANGACFICELMEETRVAEQRLRGAVAERDALNDALRQAYDALVDPEMPDRRARNEAVRIIEAAAYEGH